MLASPEYITYITNCFEPQTLPKGSGNLSFVLANIDKNSKVYDRKLTYPYVHWVSNSETSEPHHQFLPAVQLLGINSLRVLGDHPQIKGFLCSLIGFWGVCSSRDSAISTWTLLQENWSWSPKYKGPVPWVLAVESNCL